MLGHRTLTDFHKVQETEAYQFGMKRDASSARNCFQAFAIFTRFVSEIEKPSSSGSALYVFDVKLRDLVRTGAAE